MALKPDRKYSEGVEISAFMNTVVERGGMTVYETSGSGAAMDDASTVVRPTGTTGSGTLPAGLLLNDMVNLDLTRQHINWHKDETQFGGKVTLLRHGTATTNVIEAAASPSGGQPVYYTSETFGGVSNVLVFTNTDNPSSLQRFSVGQWLSQKDADGYARLEMNITNAYASSPA